MIAAEPPYHEPPDFDLPGTLNRALLFFEFLVMPILLLWGLLAFFGPFSFVLGILGLYFFLRFLSPSNLFAVLGIYRMLNPTRQDEQVPVQYFRLRDRQEREHLVRRKGVLQGHLMPGDDVALWGRWRRGLFRMSGGMNLRTGARLAVQRPRSWLWFGLNLMILIGFLWLFYEPVRRTLMMVSP